MLTTGDVLNGRYRLEEPLASGGMGHVWRAKDAVLGREVAVKLLRTTAGGDPGFAIRFRDEARTMAALHHPNVAPVYDFDAGGTDHPGYLVTAHVAGEPLDRRIAVAGRLGPAETMSIVMQAAHALHAVHRAGIVHRDVKPGNLIVQADGTVVLIDFGIARSPESAALTAPGEAVGTARYMAPEQVSKGPVTPAVDIYALGVVAYHCLAGRPPFLGGDPAAVAMSHLREDPPPLPADVPAAVRDVVTTAMAKKPSDRFPTAAAMASAAAAVGGPSAPAADVVAGAASRSAPAAAVATPARRWRRAAAWAAVLIALTAIGIVLAVTDPMGILPGPGSPPASPAPVSPDSSGGTSGGGSPGGSGGPGGGSAGTSGRPGGGGNPGGGTEPTTGPSGTAPGPTSTGDPTEESTNNPGSTATQQG